MGSRRASVADGSIRLHNDRSPCVARCPGLLSSSHHRMTPRCIKYKRRPRPSASFCGGASLASTTAARKTACTVGTMLARAFHDEGHDVVVVSRRRRVLPWRVVEWDGATPGPWTKELDGADVLINLAGRSVNCRYHARNRQE